MINADRFYEIEYVDGSKEKIDLATVCCYVNHKDKFQFTGTDIDYGKLVLLMESKKPIVIVKEIGKEDKGIEKIINTEKIKSITSKFK